MTPEHSQPLTPKRPYEVFGFTEQELLKWRVTPDRFEEILGEERTTIHKIEPSTNDFGEFLFVTTSRAGDRGRVGMTFYGLGYHKHRERWITDEWFWYQSEIFPNLLKQKVVKEDVLELLQARRGKIAPS